MSLTRFQSGSVRELLHISLPLMLSSLSGLAMVFCDRLFLSHYSGSAMSAAVTAGTLGWAFAISMIILASMAEVFVAQYNGAGIHRRIGEPVWQMIWFSFATILFFVPIGIWGGSLFFRGSLGELESRYFFWIMLFSFAFPLQGALSAFWVGRGKTLLVMLLSVAANVVNILLDWALIFGVKGIIAPQGIRGAAIGTGLGVLFQALVLLALFLRRRYHERFGTYHWRFRMSEFLKILKVGIPQSVLSFVETVGWALFYVIIAHAGREQVYVAGVCQSILILFFFVAEGLGRGAIAIAGNMIGARRPSEAMRILWSGTKIHLTFFVIVGTAFVFLPHLFSNLFIGEAFELEGVLIGGPERALIISLMHKTLMLCAVYLFFEGMRWLISGLLVAAGDTRFLMVVGISGTFVVLLLPTWIVVERFGYGVIAAWVVAVALPLILSGAFLLRFLSGAWQKITLISEETESPPA